MKKFYLFMMFAVLASLGLVNAATVTDVLTADNFAAQSTGYTDFSGVTVTSSAVYAGNSAKSNSGAIQLRSSKNNSGIVTTASAGKVTKVVVAWDEATQAGRTIDIYGKATAYTAASDLYDATNQGTLIGSIVMGTSTEFTIEGDYQFIGIRSKASALYATSISVTWETEGGDTPIQQLQAPAISGVENGKTYESATVAIAYPTGATSMTWAITKDGVDYRGGSCSIDVEEAITEEGAYEVSASATNGTDTKTAETVAFTIAKAVTPTIGYEAMDVNNVKEGKYIIVGEHEGKYYMMKNETYMKNYVAATETTLEGTEQFTADNLFTITKQGEGYTIKSEDGKYVTIEESTNGTKTYQNLRVGKDASEAVWAFADANGKVQATYGDLTNFMSFIWYAKTGTPEFSTGYQDSHLRPVFYYVGDVTPVVPEAVKVASIAEFLSKADADTEVEFTCPLTVTFQKGNSLYVTDGTDGMLIYGKTGATYANGQTFAAGVKGKYTNYNGTIELVNFTLTDATDGAAVEPTVITIADITEATQNRYSEIKSVLIDTENGTTTMVDESGQITAFNKGFCDFPANEEAMYDVVGMTAYFKGELQFYPISFTELPGAEIAAPGVVIYGDFVDPDSEEEVLYGEVELAVFMPEKANSLSIIVERDGVEVDNVTATADWSKSYTELGKYYVLAAASNGTVTSEPTDMDFEIVEKPVLAAPSFSLTEGTYTGTQKLFITSSAENAYIAGTCNSEEIYDFSPCEVTLAAPESGETTYVVTVHAELGEEQSEEATATYVIKAGEPAAEGSFMLVTNAEELKEGSQVIIVSDNNAMSFVQNVKDAAKQYRQSTTVTVEGTTIPTIGSDVAVFTVGKDGDNFTFYNANTQTETGAAMPGYLSAVSNDKNALGVQTTLDDNGKWALDFAEGRVRMLAQGDFSRNLLQYNFNGFRCYNPSTTSIDTPLAIYRQANSGVSNIAADGIKIAAGEGTISIVANAASATVYTIAGQAVAAAEVRGEATISLAAGLYIVRVGDTVAKVIVK